MKGPASLYLDLPVQDRLFDGARKLVGELRRVGHEAWIVGGAVRDMVMGVPVEEYDIATSATPEQVMSVFRHTVPVGLRFGVVMVRMSGFMYEVATFRSDVGYSDGRRPDRVLFTDLAEDVKRRDFTMNGLAMDPFDGSVQDLVGGLADIEAKIIRAIGDPGQRFAEDRLRPLRGVRFTAATGFDIEEATFEAIESAAPHVATVSIERIRDELGKLLYGRFPGKGVRVLWRAGMAGVVLPELAHLDPGKLAGVLDSLEGGDPAARWAAVLYPLGSKRAGAVMGRLRHSRRFTREVTDALKAAALIMERLPDRDAAVEKRVLRHPGVGRAVKVLQAWLGGRSEVLEHTALRLAEWGHDDLWPGVPADGRDAVAAGIPKGRQVGKALRELEDEVLRGRIADREAALSFLRSLASPGRS